MESGTTFRRWVAATVLLFTHAAAVQAENEAGQLLLNHDQPEAAIHLGTQMELNIQGMQARVWVTQQFRNQTDRWLNAAYLYPLPEDSAVTSLNMRIGERIIEGEIQEKQKARALYEAAKADGTSATLMEQQRANLFRQEIANIGPGQTVQVKIGYTQQILYDAGEFRLRFPMTLTPRYIPGATDNLLETAQLVTSTSGWALPTHQVPDAHKITPPQHYPSPGKITNPIAIDIVLEPGAPLANLGSATHRVAIEKDASTSTPRFQIGFSEGQVEMDRDFELAWTPEYGNSPLAAVFSEQWEEDTYVQLLLMPPRELDENQVARRELILVVDTSGSMAGTSIEQARESAALALDKLTSNDRFNLIFFNSSSRSLFAQAVPATESNLAVARAELQRMQANGGTEMLPALKRAFEHEATEHHLQQIVFVTDGSVGNESALLNLIHRELGSARLFTVAIGSAPNRFFMRRAAEFGRGSFTEIATGEQVRERMKLLLAKLEKPLATDLTVDWPETAEVYPRNLPDLYWGEPLALIAKLDAPQVELGGATIVISGNSAGNYWTRHLHIPMAGQPSYGTDAVPSLAQRFGRDKVQHLENQLHRSQDTGRAREQILPVALRYQLVSRFTSLVAIDKTPVRTEATADDVAVANVMPAGSRMQAVGYPQGATGLWWYVLAGCVSLAAACLLLKPRWISGVGRAA